jgi:hypothetical protein
VRSEQSPTSPSPELQAVELLRRLMNRWGICTGYANVHPGTQTAHTTFFSKIILNVLKLNKLFYKYCFDVLMDRRKILVGVRVCGERRWGRG